MSNLQLYHINDLKKQGINFKLTYKVEFTQDKKVLDEIENKGIFDNIKIVEFDNIEESVNFLIKLSDDSKKIPALYYQLNVSLKINDLIVLEDSIVTFNYTDSTCEKLRNLKFDNDIMSAELKHHVEFLNKYNSYDSFKEFKNNNNNKM